VSDKHLVAAFLVLTTTLYSAAAWAVYVIVTALV
jgi:hypothetical protein